MNRNRFAFLSLNRFISLIAICLLSFGSFSTFAGTAIHISGEVLSYKKGIYKIQTKQGLVSVQRSKLTTSLKQKLKRKVGRRVQIGVPSQAIISYKQNRSNRSPANSRKKEFRK